MNSLSLQKDPNEKLREFLKVCEWQLSRKHDPDRFDAVLRRAASARTYNVITDENYQKVIAAVKKRQKRAQVEGTAV